MDKWTCNSCNGESFNLPCTLVSTGVGGLPSKCPHNRVLKPIWITIDEQPKDKITKEKKKLEIVAEGFRTILLNNGKKYKQITGPCSTCCFRDKLNDDGTLKRSKCKELQMGFSKCGYRRWVRDYS